MKFEMYIMANRFEVLKRISVNSSLNLGLIFRSERISVCFLYVSLSLYVLQQEIR